MRFQSLFRWITFPDYFPDTGVYIPIPAFQSLFRWITFPDNLTSTSLRCVGDVSILVPLDHLPRQDHGRVNAAREKEFQSLFRWITFPDLRPS